LARASASVPAPLLHRASTATRWWSTMIPARAKRATSQSICSEKAAKAPQELGTGLDRNAPAHAANAYINYFR
jgi:hypothetical protein